MVLLVIINIPRRWRPLRALGACGTWLGAPLWRWGATSGRYNAPPMCEVILMKQMEVTESSKGTTREKKLQEVLRVEENHIKTITKVIRSSKEIYHNLPIGTTILCHDSSTLHEFTTSKIRWCNIAMKFKVDNINKIYYFDYLTRNNASTMSLLRVWDSFLRNGSHQIPSTI